MKRAGQMRDIRTKVLTGILNAALVASMVPAPALADEFEAPQATDAVATEAADEQAATSEDGVVQAESVDDAILEESADGCDAESAIESICLGETESAKSDDHADGQAGDVKPQDEHNGSDSEDKPADASTTSNGGKVSYIKRDWDGKKVTETTVDVDDAQKFPEDGKLDGGTYIVDGQKSYEGRIEVTRSSALVLADGCELDANGGIYVAQFETLSIFGGTDEGAGRIVAKAKHGAGIGAYSGHKGGNVNVHGGIIEVRGGEHCAGIGSNDGDGTDVGSFTMFGGKVTATGGDKGAGIGGGRKCEARVKIYGGEVTATGGNKGAGIGGGEKGRGGSIEICGGDVTATGGSDGAGIGGGENGCGGSIEICGGNVTATGSCNASGIGGGENRDAGKVIISGGTVHAYHRDGAGIGGGEDADGGTITITGGEVHSDYKNQGNGAGIGGGNHSGKGGTITISGGDVTVDNNYGAGIGGGRADDIYCSVDNSGAGGTITIDGGTVHTTSHNAHGIGAGGTDGANTSNTPSSGYIGSAGTITISGSADVTAEGFIAGVGGDSGTINVKGGTLTAKGLKNHDGGLGIRLIDSDAHLNVTGGVLNATGAKDQPAISANRPSFTGGTTEIRAKKPAITGAKKLKVEGGLMVKAGSSEDKAKLFPKESRVKACKDAANGYVLIAPCQHDGCTYKSVDDCQHCKICKYCDATPLEGHRFGEDGGCEICGGLRPVPAFVECKVPTDGALGVEFIVCLPKNLGLSEFEGSHMEFKVGKEDKTITVPFSEARNDGEHRYGFTCPLTSIQMADEITATYCFGRKKDVVTAATMKDTMDKCLSTSRNEELSESFAQHHTTAAYHAMADYGHYSQVFLSRERGWKLGEDHAEIAAATTIDDAACEEARAAIRDAYGVIERNRAEDVSASLLLEQGSELTTLVAVESEREVAGVTVDGEPLPMERCRRDGDRWVIALPSVSAKDAGTGHSVVVTDADGKELVTLENVSPLTYAGCVLESKQYAQDTDARNAATALYRFCEAVK